MADTGSRASGEQYVASFSDLQLKIGNIFTPKAWARFAIEEASLFDKWQKGHTIFDPTMGRGQLLEALVEYGLEKGFSLKELPIKLLFGNELNRENHAEALDRFREYFCADMSENFQNGDIFDMKPQSFDLIFGNPPWQNFNDLPASYKEKIKPLFGRYELIDNPRNLLLGGSRIDIAALVIRKVICDFLAPDGEAWFFMPLSLLLNDGAHKSFRKYKAGDTRYAPKKVYDFHNTEVFHSVSTRYGLVQFQKNEPPAFPVPYKILNNNKWANYVAAPLHGQDAPLSIYNEKKARPLSKHQPIMVSKNSVPRQGINTSGANDVFFFKSYQKLSATTCLVNDQIELPDRFVFPLLTGRNFKPGLIKAAAWVLIPYSSDGRPLTKEELNAYPKLKHYLQLHHKKLAGRKGTFINSWIKKGFWWALLGVGPYNFASYKVVWEAYGKKEFKPFIVDGHWQANQSLQAFIPFESKAEAEKVLKQLKAPDIEEYLLSMKMEGTMNWAQPGKIKKLLQFDE
ncbi:MAG: Eco57I restriction-modification methylase domain-containing protein [Bacteroidota bacterium]